MEVKTFVPSCVFDIDLCFRERTISTSPPPPPHSGNFYTKAGYNPGFVYIPENVHFVNLYKLAKIWKKQSLQDWMIIYDDLLHLVFMFTNG